MQKGFASRALALSALALAAAAATAARPGRTIAAPGSCVPVSGTITNNFTAASGTLGVVEMIYNRNTRLTCALSGQPNGQPATGSWDIDFIHTISCSDSTQQRAYDAFGNVGAVPVHSMIVMHTTGMFAAPQAPTQLRTFTESSTPLPGAPALGLFAGVTGGQIEVTGAIYTAPLPAPYGTPGAIDMRFKGKVCY